MISAIVAMANNKVIGNKNDLPWYLPADLKRFKELTTNHTVVMGRNTYDSIVARIGKPLPNRHNIVLTRDTGFTAEGVEVVHSQEEIQKLIVSNEETFIIGGAQVYESLLSIIDRIYVTEVDVDIAGDTYFPTFSDSWKEVSREHHEKDEENEYDYSYVLYERVSA